MEVAPLNAGMSLRIMHRHHIQLPSGERLISGDTGGGLLEGGVGRYGVLASPSWKRLGRTVAQDKFSIIFVWIIYLSQFPERERESLCEFFLQICLWTLH